MIEKRKARDNLSIQVEKYKNCKSYAGHKFHVIKTHQIIRKLNKTQDFKTILDIGCADGSFSKILKEEFNFDCYGFDISKNSVELANEKGIKSIVQNAEEEFQYEDETYDLIFACEIIEHLLDTDFFLSEINRILKKDGISILTTANLCSFTNRVRIMFGKFPAHGPQFRAGKGHLTTYCLPVLEKQLKENGFKTIIRSSSSIPFPMNHPKIPKSIKNLAMKLGNFFPTFGSHIIVAAKKEREV